MNKKNEMMTMKKDFLNYESPKIEVINLELEQCIAASVAPSLMDDDITETWEFEDNEQTGDIKW